MSKKLFPILIFIVGVIGYVMLVYGFWLLDRPLGLVIGGAIAMYWSWYVSIGVHLHAKSDPIKEKK